MSDKSRLQLWFCAILGISVFSGSQRAAGQPVTGRPLSGVYSLQSLIDFDSLEGAEFDPTTRVLVLAGRRWRPDRFDRVLYLDHLAASMEADSPTFSLRWTQASIDAWKQNPSIEVFDTQRRLNAFGAWLFRQGGLNLPPGTGIETFSEQAAKTGIFEKMSKGPIHVPPEIVPLAFQTPPRARLEVNRMPVRSQLAQVALEADVQAKYLDDLPELKGKIPGYTTFDEFEGPNSAAEEAQHTWVAPDGFEIRESTDGRSIRFGRTPMRFLIEKYVDGLGGKSVPDPTLTAYAQMLTRNYDAFAAVFPIFHQLRECLKVLAVAEWAKRHGWQIAMPKGGRIERDPPTDVPGVVQIIANVHSTSKSKAGIAYTIWQAGGIDLRVRDNSTIVTFDDAGRLPVISPTVYVNDQLKKILAVRTEVPLPPIPGWVAPARGGKEALSYAATQINLAGECADSALALRHLGVLRRKAEILEGIDRMINARSGNVEVQREASRLIEEANTKKEEYIKETYDALTSVLLSADELRLAEGIVYPSKPSSLFPGNTIRLVPPGSATATLKRAKWTEDVKGVLEDLRTGLQKRTNPAEYWTRVTERITELATQVAKNSAKDAGDWVDAEEMAAKRSIATAAGFSLFGLVLRIVDVEQSIQDADQLSQQASSAALDLGRLQTMRQHFFDQYRLERNRYEASLKGACRN